MKRRSALARGVKEERGQTLVEFALILPLLVLFLFGITEFALVLYNQAMITSAGRVGARVGGLYRADPTTGNYLPYTSVDVQQAISNYLNAALVSLGASSGPTTQFTAGTRGQTCAVTVTYPYTFLVLPNFVSLGQSLTLTTQAMGVIE